MDLIRDIAAERGRVAGSASPTTNAPSASLATALDFQRKAQFFLDFIEAENSMGFHAPQESARVLAHSIDFSRKGQSALRR
jgi:nitrite reductase (cytochrome c-552)